MICIDVLNEKSRGLSENMSVTRRPKFVAIILSVIIIVALVILITQSPHANPYLDVAMIIGVILMVIAVVLLYSNAKRRASSNST